MGELRKPNAFDARTWSEWLPTSAAPVEELDASHSSISSVPEDGRAAEAGSM
jgi:hypothetical protein